MLGTSVDSILSSFTKTISKLQAHSEACAVKESDNEVAINKLRATNAHLKVEQRRAQDVKKKLEELLS